LTPLDPSRSIFSAAVLGSLAAVTELTPVAGPDGLHSVVGISENFIAAAANGVVLTETARAAYNLHTEGSLITDPVETIVLIGAE
jgi:hypothetical protein